MRDSTIRFQPLSELSYSSEADNHSHTICGALMSGESSISDTITRNSDTSTVSKTVVSSEKVAYKCSRMDRCMLGS
jgi:hypothetical protein